VTDKPNFPRLIDRLGRRVGLDRRPLLDRLLGSRDEAWRVLFEEATDGIALADANGLVVTANPVLRRLANLARLDPGILLQDLVAPESRAGLRAAFDAAIVDGQTREGAVIRFATEPDETIATVAISPLREADERVAGATVRFIDITRQKRIEAQLAQNQKMQAVGQLAGGIAHDFNNLLQAIIGAVDLISAHAEPALQDDLHQVRRSAERGAALVRQLLAFGRKQTLQPRVLALNDAIEDLSSLLSRLLGERIRLVLELERPGRLIKVDPTQFDQVIMNLAVNARDAMQDGGTLTIRAGHVALFRPLRLAAQQETVPPGRYAMVEVTDTGRGIPASMLGRIFEPFFTTRRESGGTGLGLSTVYGIVRQTGGFVTVDSTEGEGTTFRIFLPRYDGPERPAPLVPPGPTRVAPLPPPPSQDAVAEPKRRLLFVEDEDAVRDLSTRALTAAGWTVLPARSGEHALELLAEAADPPDALVSDVVMPGIDGPALVRAVRERYPAIPVILMSGYAETVAGETLASERLHFLAKPFSMRDLVAKLRQVTAAPT